ncbi:MAG: OBG GTPase family GTP-binding protein [Thermoprotei archaeon]
MPTNLPAEAKAKWVKYLEARTTEEKIQALEEFLSAVPKHKGTENLVAWARRKLSELRKELEEKKSRRGGSGGPTFFIEKEGAAQVVVLGFPSSGKSSVLRALTNAKPEVGQIPFTTKLPVPGMMMYEDVQIQLIDTPAFVEGLSRGAVWWGTRLLGLARNADGLLIVLDAANNPVKQLETIVKELTESGIYLVRPKGQVQIIRGRSLQGVRVIVNGKLIGCTADDVRRLLESYRLYNSEVRIVGEVTLDEVEKAIFEKVTYKPSLTLLNKVDLITENQADSLVNDFRRLIPGIEVIPVSAKLLRGFENIPYLVFKMLNLIRIYTKEPNSDTHSPKPLILKEGSTVEDTVREIREEFLKFFRYARIWGPSAKYPGEKVGLSHRLMDKDIIEIRTTIKGI